MSDITPPPRPLVHAIVQVETREEVCHARIAIMSNERMRQEIQAHDGGQFAVPADCWIGGTAGNDRKVVIDEARRRVLELLAR